MFTEIDRLREVEKSLMAERDEALRKLASAEIVAADRLKVADEQCSRANELALRLQASEKCQLAAQNAAIELSHRLEACEAALRSFDVGRESSYWASEVEKGVSNSPVDIGSIYGAGMTLTVQPKQYETLDDCMMLPHETFEQFVSRCIAEGKMRPCE